MFRYFLQWLRQEFIDSAFERYSESLKLDGALKFPGELRIFNEILLFVYNFIVVYLKTLP